MTSTGNEIERKRGVPRWARIAGVVAVFLTLALVLLPFGLRYAGERWLREHGQRGATLRDVDLNLFTGHLELDSLIDDSGEAGRLGLRRAVLRAGWLPLLRRRVSVEDVRLEGVELEVAVGADGSVRVGRIDVPTAPAEPAPAGPAPDVKADADAEPWGFGIGNVDWQDVGVRLTLPELTVHAVVRSLHVDPLSTWEAERWTPFSLHLEVNGSPLRLDGQVRPFASGAVLEAKVQIDGLSLGEFSPLLPPGTISALSAVLGADAEIAVERGEQEGVLAVRWDGAADLDRIALTTPELVVGSGRVAWRGALMADQGATELRVRGDGTLGVEATVEAAGVGSLGLETLSWKGVAEAATAAGGASQATVTGKLALNLRAAPEAVDGSGPVLTVSVGELEVDVAGAVAAADGGELTATGGLRGRDLELGDGRLDTRLVELKAAVVEGLGWSGGSLEVERVGGEGLRLLERPGEAAQRVGPARVLELAEFEVTGLSRGPGGEMVVAEVSLGGLSGFVLRTSDGMLEALGLVPGRPAGNDPEATDVPAEATDGGAAETPSFRVGRVSLGGENTFTFRDESVNPPYQMDVADLTGSAEGIDTADPGKSTRLKFSARTGRHSSVQLQGSTSGPLERASLDLAGTIDALELPPLTGYTERHIGYRLKSGLLDADLALKAAEGQLDSNVGLMIHKLELEGVDPARLEEHEERLGLPLNSALSLLRDKNDDVQLDLPIRGDLSAPDIGIADVVQTAMANGAIKAVKTGVLAYFAPVGAIFAVGKLVGMATALRFEPVEFAPGSVELPEGSVVYLGQMAELLADRPKVRLTLCGFATPADRIALQPPPAPAVPAKAAPGAAPALSATPAPPPPAVTEAQLLELARLRSEAIQEELLAGGEIEVKRLLLCSPVVEEQPEVVPRVEIAL